VPHLDRAFIARGHFRRELEVDMGDNGRKGCPVRLHHLLARLRADHFHSTQIGGKACGQIVLQLQLELIQVRLLSNLQSFVRERDCAQKLLTYSSRMGQCNRNGESCKRGISAHLELSRSETHLPRIPALIDDKGQANWT
jgi:hypothetical protein